MSERNGRAEAADARRIITIEGLRQLGSADARALALVAIAARAVGPAAAHAVAAFGRKRRAKTVRKAQLVRGAVAGIRARSGEERRREEAHTDRFFGAGVLVATLDRAVAIRLRLIADACSLG